MGMAQAFMFKVDKSVYDHKIRYNRAAIFLLSGDWISLSCSPRLLHMRCRCRRLGLSSTYNAWILCWNNLSLMVYHLLVAGFPHVGYSRRWWWSRRERSARWTWTEGVFQSVLWDVKAAQGFYQNSQKTGFFARGVHFYAIAVFFWIFIFETALGLLVCSRHLRKFDLR